MRGDEGADYFVYKKKNNFGKKEADKVIDFSPEEGDKLIIKGKSFSIKSKKGATLAIGKGKKKSKFKRKKKKLFSKKKSCLLMIIKKESLI